MSDTLRKDRNDKQFKESLKKKSSTARYRCRCKRCVGKHDKLDKIAEKELKTEIKEMEIDIYNLDRFTPLNNGQMLEDTYGEYVLFSSVLNLFAAKKVKINLKNLHSK